MPGTIAEALQEAKPRDALGVPVATGVQALLFSELKQNSLPHRHL